ncbi:MAG: hypothetical protein OXL35_06180, partial [Chloroflexota bacterium]|nr:hypothetical protein [Chloroflexota bacterium]
ATVGTERMPAFSMEVRKPEEGDPSVADRIRAATQGYTVSARQGDYADAEGHEKVDEFHKGVEALEQAEREENDEQATENHTDEEDEEVGE